MTQYSKIASRKLGRKAGQNTPQNQPIPGREAEQIRNRAGGYVFQASELMQARRFLILGSPATYYASEKEMTISNAEVIVQLAQSNLGVELVRLISEVNTVQEQEGQEPIPAAAPRKGPSLFALAIAQLHGSEEVKQEVHAVIRGRQVITTLAQMFEFLNNLYLLTGSGKGLDGDIPMGSGLKRALRDWAVGMGRRGGSDRNGDRWLAMQFAKYRNRQFVVSKESAQEDVWQGFGRKAKKSPVTRKSHNLNARQRSSVSPGSLQ